MDLVVLGSEFILAFFGNRVLGYFKVYQDDLLLLNEFDELVGLSL